MKLYLKEPTIQDKDEILKMCKEIDELDNEYKFEGTNNLKMALISGYEVWLLQNEKDKTIEEKYPDWSNATNYIMIDENNHVYGCCTLRHTIKGNLINIGGNIGYAIRPSERKKGYGKKQLQLILEKAKEHNLKKVLITCKENNIASKKTIESFNPTADTKVPSQFPNIMELRYWIELE